SFWSGSSVRWRLCYRGLLRIRCPQREAAALRSLCAFHFLYGSSGACELSRSLSMEGLHVLAEVVRLPQPAVAMALELDCRAQHSILGVVEELLSCALSEG